MIERAARDGARRTWGYRECGTVDGNFRGFLDYFHRVEENRYKVYPWWGTLVHSLASLRLQPGESILEIGPGQGTDLVQFGRVNWACHAVDITEAHLRSTARNFGCRGLPTPTLHKADATNLPYGQRFDMVLMSGVLHHIPEDDLVLDEVYRVLRPGGVFVMTVYNKWSWFHLYKVLTGIWSGGLRRLGYDGWMSTLEEGADGIERKPFIRLYDRRRLHWLLDQRWVWKAHTECGSPLPDWTAGSRVGGWFHVVVAVKR